MSTLKSRTIEMAGQAGAVLAVILAVLCGGAGCGRQVIGVAKPDALLAWEPQPLDATARITAVKATAPRTYVGFSNGERFFKPNTDAAWTHYDEGPPGCDQPTPQGPVTAFAVTLATTFISLRRLPRRAGPLAFAGGPLVLGADRRLRRLPESVCLAVRRVRAAGRGPQPGLGKPRPGRSLGVRRAAHVVPLRRRRPGHGRRCECDRRAPRLGGRRRRSRLLQRRRDRDGGGRARSVGPRWRPIRVFHTGGWSRSPIAVERPQTVWITFAGLRPDSLWASDGGVSWRNPHGGELATVIRAALDAGAGTGDDAGAADAATFTAVSPVPTLDAAYVTALVPDRLGNLSATSFWTSDGSDDWWRM